MVPWMWIFGVVLLCGATWWRVLSAQSLNNTSCEEFERGARFNPYHIIQSMWKIFYYWADNTEIYPIVFSLPERKRLLKFKETIDAIDPQLAVEWEKATLFMNPRPGTEVLFLYQGTIGAFRALVKKEQRSNKVRPYPIPQIKFADVRMKLVGNYLGMMCCEDYSAFALASTEHVPTTEAECERAAATLGFRGPHGKSYLYLRRRSEEEL